MDHSEFAMWEIAKQKLADLRHEADQYRLSKEFSEPEQRSSSDRSQMLMLAVALLGAVLWLLVGV
jgi:hypothetical protein